MKLKRYFRHIKNSRQAIKLIFWIMQEYNLNNFNQERTAKDILKVWVKKGERGKEIFKLSKSLDKDLSGDCDDMTTLLVSKYSKNKKRQIGFLANKKGGIYHIFTILDGVVYDAWAKRVPFKIQKAKHIYKSAAKIIIINLNDIVGG